MSLVPSVQCASAGALHSHIGPLEFQAYSCEVGVMLLPLGGVRSRIQSAIRRLRRFQLVGFKMRLELWVGQLKDLNDLVFRCVDYLDAGNRVEASRLERLHPVPHLFYRVLYCHAPAVNLDCLGHRAWKGVDLGCYLTLR